MKFITNKRIITISIILIVAIGFSIFLNSCFNKEDVVKQIILDSWYKKPIKEVDIITTPEMKNYFLTFINENAIRENGAAGENYPNFKLISSQRSCLDIIQKGIAIQDESLIDLGAKMIEYGFSNMNTDGSFSNEGGTTIKTVGANAFFLQAVGHSYLILEKSKYKKYLFRLNELKPKIQLALSFLENNKDELYRQDSHAANRLAFDAGAFKLNGILLKDYHLQFIGNEFINKYMETQGEDGVFFENGGYDSSYQMVGIRVAFPLFLYSPSWVTDKSLESLISALKKGIEWEKTRILENGKLNFEGNSRVNPEECALIKPINQCKPGSYKSVVKSFYYDSYINLDSESKNYGDLVLDHFQKNELDNNGD